MRHIGKLTSSARGIACGILLSALAMGLLHGNEEKESSRAPEENRALLENVRPKAAPVAKSLMQSLSGRLMEAMGTGGPAAAIKVCRDEAMQLTEEVRSDTSVQHLKRVGLRLRNADNAPDIHETRALEYFTRKGIEEGEYPSEWAQEVTLGDGSRQWRYYRAIPLQARCVGCHGPKDQIPAVIRETLAEAYPGDAATGFQPGQLRGLMVVGIEAAE